MSARRLVAALVVVAAMTIGACGEDIAGAPSTEGDVVEAGPADEASITDASVTVDSLDASAAPDADAAIDDDEAPPGVLAAGGSATCFAKDGALRCWGSNQSAQQTIWPNDLSHHGVTTIALPEVTDVALSTHHVCAVAGGKLHCWGSNAFNNLGHDRALDRSDGGTGNCISALGFVCNERPIEVPSLAPTSVTVDDFYSCAMDQGGAVDCFGATSTGVCGVVDAPATCAGGTACTPGPNRLAPLPPVAQISAGGAFACAREAAGGAVWCWGTNGYGTLGPSAGGLDAGNDNLAHPVPRAVGVAGARVIVAGGAHVCAVRADRTVTCWGSNVNAQLGHPPAQDPLCFPDEPCSASAVPVQGVADVRGLALGLGHTCALLRSGKVLCWGKNDSGQLGHAPANDADPLRVAPVEVPGISDAASIAAGASHTCALRRDASVYCWGSNGRGQVNGTGISPVTTPVPSF